jgi:aconitate hydratase
MGAEIGATTSVFPFNDRMYDYLVATKRKILEISPESTPASYERTRVRNTISSSSSTYLSWSRTLMVPLRLIWQLRYLNSKEAVAEHQWPEELKVGLIGSCTNSSYEDMSRAASIARDALNHGIKAKSIFTVTPGSEQSVPPSSAMVSLEPLRNLEV